MADIKSGDDVSALWWPESVRAYEGTDQLDQTSTSFIAGSPECSTTFTAPLSGRSLVVIAGGMRNDDVALNRIFISYEIRLGSSAGAVVVAASAFRSITTSGDANPSGIITRSNMFLAQGLTPKATYFIRTMHQVSGGTTNDIFFRRVCVIPTS